MVALLRDAARAIMAPRNHDARGSVRPEAQASRRRPFRRAWHGLAAACIGLAGVGVALPLVPTTPFLLLAAWAASRGSPELHDRLYRHPRYGPILRDWREHRALRPPVKRSALLLIAASWVVLLMTIESTATVLVGSGVMAGVAIFLATRPAHPDGR